MNSNSLLCPYAYRHPFVRLLLSYNKTPSPPSIILPFQYAQQKRCELSSLSVWSFWLHRLHRKRNVYRHTLLLAFTAWPMVSLLRIWSKGYTSQRKVYGGPPNSNY